MKVSPTSDVIAGRAATRTKTLQLWNWNSVPILKPQPIHTHVHTDNNPISLLVFQDWTTGVTTVEAVVKANCFHRQAEISGVFCLDESEKAAIAAEAETEFASTA